MSKELKIKLINLINSLIASNTGEIKEITTSDGLEEVEVYKFHISKGAEENFKELIKEIEELR